MARIAIFDSGVGGLTIHQALRKRMPHNEYFFVSDNEAHPYGIKDEEFLVARVENVVLRIVEKLAVDLVVIACNTASTVALPHLRESHIIPIVGVVPAIKPAAKASKSRCIAVLGTPATIARPYTDALIDEFASDCEVIRVGSSILVEQAEAKVRGKMPDVGLIKQELKPIINSNGCDTIVLACTHFPLLDIEIGSILNVENTPSDRLLVDSGEAIARRVSILTEMANVLIKEAKILNSSSFTTRDIHHEEALLSALESRNLPYAGVL